MQYVPEMEELNAYVAALVPRADPRDASLLVQAYTGVRLGEIAGFDPSEVVGSTMRLFGISACGPD